MNAYAYGWSLYEP